MGQLLLVDDEQSVLDGLYRRLEDDFEVTCCISPAEALEAMREQEFSAVLTDMRMPQMNGLEFIRAARDIAPHSMYMMLTGTQDLQTARDAVNEGREFRYLTKPCNSAELLSAISSAIELYDRASAESDITQSAFSGSIKVLNDMLSSGDYRISILSERIKRLWNKVSETIGWENKPATILASRLCLVGATTLNETQLHAITDPALAVDEVSHKAFTKTFQASGKILGRLPKLNDVILTVEAMYESTGALERDSKQIIPNVHNQGTALGLTVAYVISRRKSESVNGEMLRLFYPELDTELLTMIQLADQQSLPEHDSAELYPIKQLFAGMVFAKDVVGCDGKKVFSCNDLVTKRLYEVLSTLSNLPDQVHVSLT